MFNILKKQVEISKSLPQVQQIWRRNITFIEKICKNIRDATEVVMTNPQNDRTSTYKLSINCSNLQKAAINDFLNHSFIHSG